MRLRGRARTGTIGLLRSVSLRMAPVSSLLFRTSELRHRLLLLLPRQDPLILSGLAVCLPLTKRSRGLISDSLYFVQIARRLERAFFSGGDVEVPSDNADVWEFFLTCLKGCQTAEYVWVKAHRVSGLEGFEQVMASGNAFADQVAKMAVHRYKASSALYQKVVMSKLCAVKIRNQVDAFHLHLAFAAIGLQQDLPRQVVTPVQLVPEGSPWTVGSPELLDSGFHQVFVCQVFNWFCALRWFEGCSPGPVADISWVELFLWWIVDSGTLPPFRVDGCWVRIGEDEDAICCIPSAYTLYKAWRRAVSFVLRRGILIPGVPVASALSAASLGASVPLSGVTWRPRVPLGVRQDFAVQLSSLRSLHSLRLPPLW